MTNRLLDSSIPCGEPKFRLPAGCFTVSEWKDRNIPPKDWVWGNVMSTTCRVMLYGATGIGKTQFVHALGYTIATGQSFLRWSIPEARKVLIVDGEMSEQDLQERITDMDIRQGLHSQADNLIIMSRETVEADGGEFFPLNTSEGQKMIDDATEAIKPDIVILDNYMTLTSGDRMTDEGWQEILPWILSFSWRKIGIIIIHHTGKNGDIQYGSEAKLFQLNTVMRLASIDAEGDSGPLAFRLKFTKNRSAKPEVMSQFADASIKLEDDGWVLTDDTESKANTIERFWRMNKELPKQERYTYSSIGTAAGCSKGYVGKVIKELEDKDKVHQNNQSKWMD